MTQQQQWQNPLMGELSSTNQTIRQARQKPAFLDWYRIKKQLTNSAAGMLNTSCRHSLLHTVYWRCVEQQQIFLLVKPNVFYKAYRNATFCLRYLFQVGIVPDIIFQNQLRRQLWLPNTGHNDTDNIQSCTWIQAIWALEPRYKVQLLKSLNTTWFTIMPILNIKYEKWSQWFYIYSFSNYLCLKMFISW